jgi:hypothetical protein
MAESNPAIELDGVDTLDVTQHPDGTLIDARLSDNSIYYYKPNEPATSALVIKSVFPRRGGQAGGLTLTVYGKNFGPTMTVTVGGSNCPVITVEPTKVKCKLPGGPLGKVDVVVTAGAKSAAFKDGYRYISGYRR